MELVFCALAFRVQNVALSGEGCAGRSTLGSSASGVPEYRALLCIGQC